MLIFFKLLLTFLKKRIEDIFIVKLKKNENYANTLFSLFIALCVVNLLLIKINLVLLNITSKVLTYRCLKRNRIWLVFFFFKKSFSRKDIVKNVTFESNGKMITWRILRRIRGIDGKSRKDLKEQIPARDRQVRKIDTEFL